MEADDQLLLASLSPVNLHSWQYTSNYSTWNPHPLQYRSLGQDPLLNHGSQTLPLRGALISDSALSWVGTDLSCCVLQLQGTQNETPKKHHSLVLKISISYPLQESVTHSIVLSNNIILKNHPSTSISSLIKISLMGRKFQSCEDNPLIFLSLKICYGLVPCWNFNFNIILAQNFALGVFI